MKNIENIEESFLTIKEFASLLKVHPNTIRRAISNGRIGGFRIGSGPKSIYRIPKSEVNRMALIDLEKLIDKRIEEKFGDCKKL